MQRIRGLESIDKTKLPKKKIRTPVNIKQKALEVQEAQRAKSIRTRKNNSSITITPKTPKTSTLKKKSLWNRFLGFIGVGGVNKHLSKNEKMKQEILVLKNTIKLQEDLYQEKYPYVKNTRKLQEWSKRVRRVGKCDICSETKNLTAHHLWDKQTHPTLMYQDENGVCLCNYHHTEFHKKYYGAIQRTPSQYYKFKNSTIFWENKENSN